jgi:hypothetical protein
VHNSETTELVAPLVRTKSRRRVKIIAQLRSEATKQALYSNNVLEERET